MLFIGMLIQIENVTAMLPDKLRYGGNQAGLIVAMN
jgi:hypothetical protein